MLEKNILPNKGFIEINGYQLRYSIEGSGLPTLVIGSEIYYPRTFSKNLRKHLKLIFMDHRGFGIAPKREMQNAEFELDILVDDVEEVRQRLGLNKIIVLGHSGHAFIALEYAKKYPQHVSHVVMLGVIPSLSDKNKDAIDQFWQEFASPERKAALEKNEEKLPDEKLKHLRADQQFIQQYIRSTPKIWYDYDFDMSHLWEGIEINMQMLGYVWGVLFRDIDITKGLNQLNKPVFLGLGKHDYLAPYILWNSVRSHFKDLTTCIFEESGHTPQMEETEMFDQKLMQWINTHSSGR